MVNIDIPHHFNLKHLKILSILFFFIESIYLIIFLNTWYDETNYLYESWLFVDQHLMPYIDYSAKVPVIPYIIYGVPQSLFETSIYIGRMESFIFTGLMLLLVYKLAKTFVDEKAGIFSVLLILFNFYSMQYFISATLYSLSALFLLLSLYILFSEIKEPFKSIISIIFIDLAILTRPNIGFAGIILLFYILSKNDVGMKTKFASISTAISIPIVVLLPFLLENFKLTIFQIPFTPIQDILGLEYPNFVNSAIKNLFLLKLTFPFEYFHITFFMVLVIGSFLIYLLYNKKYNFFEINVYFPLMLLMVISLVLLTYVFHPYPVGPYIVYAIPMMAILAGTVYSTIINTTQSENCKGILYSVFIVGLILTTISIVPYSAAPFKDTSVMKAERGAEALANYTNPDDKILSLLYTNGEVLLAERVIYPNTIHFPWTYQPLSSKDDCEEYFKFNDEMLDNWLSGEADVVLISDWTYFYLSSPPYLENKKGTLDLIDKKLEENYILTKIVEDSFNPNLKIYVGKEQNVVSLKN